MTLCYFKLPMSICFYWMASSESYISKKNKILVSMWSLHWDWPGLYLLTGDDGLSKYNKPGPGLVLTLFDNKEQQLKQHFFLRKTYVHTTPEEFENGAFFSGQAFRSH